MDPMTIAASAVTFLTPYLAKAGEKAAEKVSEKLPDAVGAVWKAITARFKDRPAAEEAVKDLAANPQDEDNRAAFRKELRKVLESEPAFTAELQRLLNSAQREAGDIIISTGSGAVATNGGVAAGEGGVAVKGDVHGRITIGGAKDKG